MSWTLRLSLATALLCLPAAGETTAHDGNGRLPAELEMVRLQEVLDSCALMQCVLSEPLGNRQLASAWGAHEQWAAWAAERPQFELTQQSTLLRGLANARGGLHVAERPSRWAFVFSLWGSAEQEQPLTLAGMAASDQAMAWLDFEPKTRTFLLYDPSAHTLMAFDAEGRTRWRQAIPRSISLFDNPVQRPPGFLRTSEWTVLSYWQLRRTWDYPSIEHTISPGGRQQLEFEFSWARLRFDVLTGFVECLPRRGNIRQSFGRLESQSGQ